MQKEMDADQAEYEAYQQAKAIQQAEQEREREIRSNAAYLVKQQKQADEAIKSAEAAIPTLSGEIGATEEAWAEDEATSKKTKWFGLSSEPTASATEAQSRLEGHKSTWTKQKEAIDANYQKAATALQKKEALATMAGPYDAAVAELDAREFAATHERLTGQKPKFSGLPATTPRAQSPNAQGPQPDNPTNGQTSQAPTEPKTTDSAKWDDADKSAWRSMTKEQKKTWGQSVQAQAQEKTDAKMEAIQAAEAKAPVGEHDWLEESRRAWNRTSPGVASRLASATRLLYNTTGATPPEWTDHIAKWAAEQNIENKASDSLSNGQFSPENPRWWLANGIPATAEMVADLGIAGATGPAAPFTFMALGGAKMAGDQYADATRYYQEEEGLSRADAEQKAIGEALLVGALGTVLEKLPASEFLTKNKLFTGAIRNILARRGIAGLTAEFTPEVGQELSSMAAAAGFRGDPKAFENWKARLATAGTLGGAIGSGADISIGAMGDLKARTQKQAIDKENSSLDAEAAAVNSTEANTEAAKKWNEMQAASYAGNIDEDLAGWDPSNPETGDADKSAHPFILQTKIDSIDSLDTTGLSTQETEKIGAARAALQAALDAAQVTPEIMGIVSTLSADKGGDLTRADAEITEAKAEITALDATRGTFWNPADHEARLTASVRLNTALKTKIALGQKSPDTREGVASTARLIPIAREVASHPDTPADPNRNGKLNGSSQRQIAIAIAKLSQGIPLSPAEINLRSGSVSSPGPVFSADKKTGRVTIRNPETARSLAKSSPALSAAYASYESGSSQPSAQPQPKATQATKDTSGHGRYRAIWKRDGEIVGESAEFSAPDSAIAAKLAAEQPIPAGIKAGDGAMREVETIAEPAPARSADTKPTTQGSTDNSAPKKMPPKVERMVSLVKSLAAQFPSLFPNGVQVVPESRNSGGLFYLDGTLFISLADTETQVGSQTNLRAKFVEEFIHAALVRADIDAEGFFAALPARLQSQVRSAYADASKDYQRGHEALRMFFQGKLKLSQAGEITWVDIGGGMLSEQSSPAIGTKLREILRTLLTEFKRLRATLAGNAPALTILNDAEKAIRSALAGLPKTETPAADHAKPSPGKAASVPLMITRQMEADLLARGKTQAEINKMTPAQAWEFLNSPEPNPVDNPTSTPENETSDETDNRNHRGTGRENPLPPRSSTRRIAGIASQILGRIQRRLFPEMFRTPETGRAILAFGAEISAVAEGRKPLFHENFLSSEAAAQEAAAALQEQFPGLLVGHHGTSVFVAHPARIEEIINSDPFHYYQDHRTAIIEAIDNDGVGELLGYGVRTRDGGDSIVEILDSKGNFLAGFVANEADSAIIAERVQDYSDALNKPARARLSPRAASSTSENTPPPFDETEAARALTEKEYAVTQLDPEDIRPFLRGEMEGQGAGTPRLPYSSLEKIGAYLEASGRTEEAAIIHDELARRGHEEMMAENEAAAKGDYELLEAVRLLGGFPTTDSILQEEINTLREHKAAKQPGLFRRNADPLDILRSNLFDYGFHFDTPSDLIDAAETRFATRKPHYGQQGSQELRSQSDKAAIPLSALADIPEAPLGAGMGPPVKSEIAGVSSKDIFESAKKRHGLTNSLEEAGYVLPDGSMLDFTGRADAGYRRSPDNHFRPRPGERDWMKDQRSVDHREIEWEGQPEYKEIWEPMRDFMSLGAIRIDGKTGTISIHGRFIPTRAQQAVLRDIVNHADGSFLDMEDDSGNRAGVHVDGAKWPRVKGLLTRWANGSNLERETEARTLFSQTTPVGDIGLTREAVAAQVAREYGIREGGAFRVVSGAQASSNDILETEHYSLSRADAKKPTDEILSPTGHRDWGVFTDWDAAHSGGHIQAGPIRILKGRHFAKNKGYGLDHIEAEHADDFARFSEPMEAVIHRVLLGFNEVYLQGDGRLLLTMKRPTLVAAVELRHEGAGFYSVVTAFPKENPAWKPNGVRILDGRRSAFAQSERAPARTAQGTTSPNPPLEPLAGKYPWSYLREISSPVKDSDEDIRYSFNSVNYGDPATFRKVPAGAVEKLLNNGWTHEEAMRNPGLFKTYIEKNFLNVPNALLQTPQRAGTHLDYGMTSDLGVAALPDVFLRALAGPKGVLYSLADPNQWEGRSIFDQQGNLLRIELNADNLHSPEDVRRVLEHELGHAATEAGGLREEISRITDAERKQIAEDMARLGYAAADTKEADARAVDALREAWKGRTWFQRTVAHIYALAKKAGLKLSDEKLRLLAERAAVRAVAAEARKLAARGEQERSIFRQMLVSLPKPDRARVLNIDGGGYLVPPDVHANFQTNSRFALGAYHGTPHEIEGGFSLGKIGTGEGALVYGWGLYFAENEDVARNYRSNLSRKRGDAVPFRVKTIWDDPYYGLTNNGWQAQDSGQFLYYSSPEAEALDAFVGRKDRDEISDEAKAILDSGDILETEDAGNLYTVELDVEEGDLLDWDKPLSEQSEKVREVLKIVPEKSWDSLKNWHGQLIDGRRIYALFQNRGFGYMPGQFDDTLDDEKQASKKLLSLGIPGIRYLDQESRATSGGQLIGVWQGEQSVMKDLGKGKWFARIKVFNRGGIGFASSTDSFTTSSPFNTEAESRRWADSKIHSATHNYVIFDESKIRITHRNGDAVTLNEAGEIVRNSLDGPSSSKPVDETPAETTGSRDALYSQAASREVSPADYPATMAVAHFGTNVSSVENHRAFKAAKEKGNAKAGADLVNDLFRPEKYREMISALDRTRPIYIVPIQARESERANTIPIAFARRLAKEIGGNVRVWQGIHKRKGAHNTGAAADVRSRSTQEFRGKLPPPGAQIIVADDTFTTGNTLTGLIDYLSRDGRIPEFAATLAAGRYQNWLAATPDKTRALLDKAGLSAEEFTHELGFPPSTLTGSEIQFYILNGGSGRVGLLRRFDPRRIPQGERLPGRPIRHQERGVAPSGHAQPLTEPVSIGAEMADMGRLTTGHPIAAPGGDTAAVAAIYPQGEQPVLRVTLPGTRSTLATADHLWPAKIQRKIYLLTTAEIIAAQKQGNMIYLPTQ